MLDIHNVNTSRERKHTFLLNEFAFCNIYKKRLIAEHHEEGKRYKKEIDIVGGKIANLAKDYDWYIVVLERALELVENIGKAYQTADYNQKKSFLYMFFTKILID